MENPSPLEREINPIHRGMCRSFPSGWICWGYADGAHAHCRGYCTAGGSSWFNCGWRGEAGTRVKVSAGRGPPSFRSQKHNLNGSGFQQTCRHHLTPDPISVLPPTERQRRGGGAGRGGARWKLWPRRQWRNRCWADGTWQRYSALKR